ncbi:MAG: tryptophan--tRNA ligase, partial [Actinobacteria bacterium]|nr:tryptophan--tRNA ligase [Actinomycetota bacterium]
DEQDRYDNYFMIADLHALTIPENVQPDALRSRIREALALYIACGLDPSRSAIFRQSDISAHATLAWILGCVTPVGWLERMTQYKSKSSAVTASAGLFTYPALQAADILLYQADFVPVGDDQRQHIEITRDIAQRFNHLFGDVFTLPEPLIRKSGARIMGLDDPSIKMSKSLAGTRDGHAIGLLDSPDKIRRTVMRAVTDSKSKVNIDQLSPGLDNLLVLFETLAGLSREVVLAKFAGQGYGALKRELADIAIEKVGTIQARYRELQEDYTTLDTVLAEGASKAQSVANVTLQAAMGATGLR